MDWLKAHGGKALTGLLTILTAANGYAPQALADLFGASGDRWVTFALSLAALAHATFVAPATAPPGLPPPTQKQGGRVRLTLLGFIVALSVLEYAAFRPLETVRRPEIPATIGPRQAVTADPPSPCPAVHYD